MSGRGNDHGCGGVDGNGYPERECISIAVPSSDNVSPDGIIAGPIPLNFFGWSWVNRERLIDGMLFVGI
jgi:hypothetical protein